MPLVAIHRDTGARLVSFLHAEQINAARGALVCPHCREPLSFVDIHRRRGFEVIAHFRHPSTCETSYASHPESREHMLSKQRLAVGLPKVFPALLEAECVIEYRFDEVDRIADVCFVFPDGYRVVAEAQLANITTDDLRRRTEDYHRAGADVWWFVGGQAARHLAWLRDTYGSAGQIEFTYDTETVTLPDFSHAAD